MSIPTFDAQLAAIQAGRALPADELAQLAAAPDILPLGMLADEARRHVHGRRVTYVRIAPCAFDHSFAEKVPPAAREVRITGAPDTLAIAVTAVTLARAAAGERTVTGFGWADVIRWSSDGRTPSQVVEELHRAGLDGLTELPLDQGAAIEPALEALAAAGYQRICLTIRHAPLAERLALFAAAEQLQQRHGIVQALNPLPMQLDTFRPTTGYEDVKSVALARLAAPAIPTIQIDWLRYGPKLAQVALTFGADDLDGVDASDDAPEGRRRAPLEEVRRNIEAAGFSPAERDGRYNVIA